MSVFDYMSDTTTSLDLEPEPVSRYSLRRMFLLAVAFILAAPLFWQRTQINPDSVPAAYENADLYQTIYPTFSYGFGRLRAGDLPLWNPKQICGTPFLANPQTAVFEPLNAVFLLPLSTERAMALHAFVCLALMGLFFTYFARSLGIDYVPAFVGGVTYAFCGASAAAISRPAFANAMVLTPLLFWALREGFRDPRRGRIVPAGVVAALLILNGANALSFFVLMGGLAYGVFATLWAGTERPGMRVGIEKLIILFAIAALLSAVQWIPTFVWAIRLDRPFEALFALQIPGQAAASVQELIAQILTPKPGPLPRLGYVGAIALLGIPAALAHPWLRRETAWFLFSACILLFVSAGASAAIPLAFPYACAVFPAMFCIASLAAIGFDRLLMSSREPHTPHAGLPAAFIIPCAVFLFYIAGAEPRGRVVIFALLTLPVLLFRIRWISNICGVVVAMVLFADLATASLYLYRHPFEDAPGCYRRYAKTIDAAEEQALGMRVLVSAPALDFGLPANLAMIVPALHDVNGHAPLTRNQAIWWRRLAPAATARMDYQGTQVMPEAPSPSLLDFMSARLILAAPESPLYPGVWQNPGPAFREVRTEDAVRLFMNDSALPRALWTPAWKMVEGVASAADALAAPDFDGTRTCVVDRDSRGYSRLVEEVPVSSGADATDATPAAAICAIAEDTPERVVVQVNAPKPGVTVLADSYDPGWNAAVDGVRCPVLCVNGIFRGVATPPGAHEIVFTYEPASFFVGLVLSLATLGLLSLAAIVGLFAK